MKRVLITGGNGLIGSRLQQMLISRGYSVHVIGRTKAAAQLPEVVSFAWDVRASKMDLKALDGVDAIIHLAGAGIADQRWSATRKKEILSSRIDSTRLLYSTLARNKHSVKTIISASAVGYYGDCGADIVSEDRATGEGFLADVTSKWEKEVKNMDSLGIRHVCCRIGIVLSQKGGALPELERTMPMGIAGYFAKSPLYYSWIHIDDVCGIMIHALENTDMAGSYNTTAPDPVLIKNLIKAIVSAKRSKALVVPVPPFAVRLALGEMSDAVLQSQRCSDKKIVNAGYKFLFPQLKGALENIYSQAAGSSSPV